MGTGGKGERDGGSGEKRRGVGENEKEMREEGRGGRGGGRARGRRERETSLVRMNVRVNILMGVNSCKGAGSYEHRDHGRWQLDLTMTPSPCRRLVSSCLPSAFTGSVAAGGGRVCCCRIDIPYCKRLTTAMVYLRRLRVAVLTMAPPGRRSMLAQTVIQGEARLLFECGLTKRCSS
eukprot:768319-Hanusia_phi.AAC.3